MSEDKNQIFLQLMRQSVKAYQNAAKKMKRRSDSIAEIFENISKNKLPFEKSVAFEIQEAGVSITLLSFFNRSQNRCGLAQNMFFMNRMIMEEASEFLEYDEVDAKGLTDDGDCQADFYYFILSNYKATPSIKNLIHEWKELGVHDCRNTQQHDKFREIFTSLEIEFAKDKFKIKECFIDLV